MLFIRSLLSIASVLFACTFVPVQQEQSTEFSATEYPANPAPEKSAKGNPNVIATETSALSPLELERVQRQQRLEKCLAENYTVTLSADALRPWSIMHGILAYGLNATVVTKGHYVNSVQYLCANGRGHDRNILSIENESLVALTGRGVQGHEAQLLAMLAQVDVPEDQEITVAGRAFTLQDLIRNEQATCRAGSELTFKLMGLSCYLPSDAVWRNDQGQAWDIQRLIHEEISQPINGSACGGLHRLMGLSYALEIRKVRQEPIDGQWQRIAHFVQGYQERALAFQNPDGSFSTEWFDGPGNRSDLARRIYTTGHTLEWLAFSLPDEELQSPPMLRAVDAMLEMLPVDPQGPKELHALDVGPKGHALRALRLFERRVYGQASDHLQLVDRTDLMLEPADAFLLQTESKLIESAQVAVPASSVSHSKSKPDAVPQQQPARRSRFMRRR